MPQDVSGTIIVAHAEHGKWGRGKTIQAARKECGIPLRDMKDATIYYCEDPEAHIDGMNIVYARGTKVETLSPV